MRQLIIAIDGPSGAGKGTVARAVAAALGYRHVDSGAMYRAVGWKALRDGVPLDDEAAVAALAAASRIGITDERVAIDDVDVTRAIRTPEIDRAAAAVARLPRVRAILVERQRAMGSGGGIAMEGRDIGTVVFPQADVKVYLITDVPAEGSVNEVIRLQQAYPGAALDCWHHEVRPGARDVPAPAWRAGSRRRRPEDRWFAVAVVSWRMAGRHGESHSHTLRLRAPAKPGAYRLYVEAAGHAAKAFVVVA